MMAARALACALMIVACGAGDMVLLGGAVTGGAGSAAAPGGGGGGAGAQAGSGGSAMPDAGWAAPVDASNADGGEDATADGSTPDLCQPRVTSTVGTCSRPPSEASLELSVLFAWPPGSLLEPRPTLANSSLPLVANFTDDNGDGRVDLCDTPDVLVLALPEDGGRGALLYLLSGDNGELHRVLPTPVADNVTPALADLDRDGDIEIVTLSPDGRLLVLDASGAAVVEGAVTTLWGSVSTSCVAMAIADLDGDDAPEIIAGYDVLDASGRLLFRYGGDYVALETNGLRCVTPLATDIEPSRELEVAFAPPAIHAARGELLAQPLQQGEPQVVETSGHGLPEMVVVNGASTSIIHEGGASTLIQDLCASAALAALDVDGDDVLEVAFADCGLRLVELANQTLVVPRWQNEPRASTGLLTAFDFLGDGVADLVHATASGLAVHDGATGALLSERAELPSGDLPFGGPVVADVDNDGSADVLVIAERGDGPTLFALGSSTGGFVPARRFYNQYANQVTHFDELGRTVALPPSFRVSHQNAQIEDGLVCIARPR